jgi:tetratricopeptide (TPR) repeat protein
MSMAPGALSKDETNYGPEHPKVAIDLNDLAELLPATNRLAEAEPLYHRAIASFEKLERDTGHGHPMHARTLFNLTGLLRTREFFADRIEPMMRNALSIHETSYGPEHPEVAADLNSLARLLQATKRLAEAEPMMRRAFSIDEKVFHPEHPKVARDLNNLAQLLQDTDRLAEAKPLMHRAANVFEQSLGADHPSTRTARENLAVLESEIARTAAGCPAADSASLVPGVTNQSSKPPRPGILARWFGRG